MRNVKNTSGEPDERLVIETMLVLNRRRWHIEVTLADRTNMTMPLILGRTALRRHRVLVDPGKSHLLRRMAKPDGPAPTHGPRTRSDPMKIAMLARNPNLYSHKRLKEAAEARGHDARHHQHAALLHEHRLAAARDLLQRREAAEATTR